MNIEKQVDTKHLHTLLGKTAASTLHRMVIVKWQALATLVSVDIEADKVWHAQNTLADSPHAVVRFSWNQNMVLSLNADVQRITWRS